VDGYVVNIDSAGKKPVKNIADNAAVTFGQDRARTGYLKFLTKKSGAPGKAERGAFDHHHFVHVGNGHRPEAQAVVGRKKATAALCALRPLERLGF
jgi:hypothetical protein